MVTIKDILDYLDSERVEYCFEGDTSTTVEWFSSLNGYKEGTITWVKNRSEWDKQSIQNVLCVITKKEVCPQNIRQIVVENPKNVFFDVVRRFWGNDHIRSGIGNNTYICDDVLIKDNVYIGHNCCLDGKIIIGEGSYIGNNVTIMNNVRIGKYCRIDSGVVIGCDGGGFSFDEDDNPHRVAHFGGVMIGDRVEIGCNSVIDRGTIDDTVISCDSKITNLVSVGHNAVIGNGCMIMSGAVLCGSVKIDEKSYIGPGAVIRNHITVGGNSFIGMNAVLDEDCENNSFVYRNKDNCTMFPNYRKLL